MSRNAITDTMIGKSETNPKKHTCNRCNNLVMLIGGKYQCSKLRNTTLDVSIVSVVNDCRNWKAK